MFVLRPYLMFVILFVLALPQTSEARLVQLLQPQELQQLFDRVIIIDARPLAEWRKGHIPGARQFGWQDSTATDGQNIAYPKLANEQLAERLGRLGINEQSELVIYGDANSSWGAEGWVCWLLRELGHAGEVYLLDGGVQAWQKQWGELTVAEPPTVAPVAYRVDELGELGVNTADLQQPSELQLVDTRSFFEWLRGSIPGAVRIHWTDFFRGRERRPLDRKELITLLEKNGIDPHKPIAYYCSAGIRSAYAWTVHELAGLQTAKNYAGGMEAWRKSL